MPVSLISAMAMRPSGKMESHNLFIEPTFAATGVGGIMCVFTMGARPVANLNALRFGHPDHPKPATSWPVWCRALWLRQLHWRADGWRRFRQKLQWQ